MIYERRINYYETDAMQIVHHSNYIRFMEEARTKILADIGLPYSKIDDEYKQRLVAVMLMDYYLTDEYIDMSLEVLDSLKNEKYYCKMAVAWAIATAWAKQREKTFCYMQDGNNTLDDWTYNKAIQKMLESYRVSDEDKRILRTMKRM